MEGKARALVAPGILTGTIPGHAASSPNGSVGGMAYPDPMDASVVGIGWEKSG